MKKYLALLLAIVMIFALVSCAKEEVKEEVKELLESMIKSFSNSYMNDEFANVVYIDNELPQNYVLDYENHIKTCSECSAKLEQLKKIKGLIISDANTIYVDDNYIEQSFLRLETKLRHSKNTIRKINFPTEYVKWGAVAAIFVAVILPFGNNLSKDKKSSNLAITPIIRPQSVAPTNNNVIINGNISDNLAKNVSTNAKNTRLADVEVLLYSVIAGLVYKLPLPFTYSLVTNVPSSLIFTSRSSSIFN